MKHTCFFVYKFIVQASIRDKLSQMAPVLDSIAGLAATAQSGLSSNQTKKKIIRCTAAPKGPSVLNSWVQ